MLDSFEQFKSAVWTSLKAKIETRLEAEREAISNNLMRGELVAAGTENTEETQSNEVQN